MKTKHAEYIDLQWEDDVHDYNVRGHVEPEDADLALREYFQSEYGDDAEVPEHGPWKHAYGRWSMHYDYDNGGGRQMLETYDEPGRGRFPITSAEDQDLITLRAKWRANGGGQ